MKDLYQAAVDKGVSAKDVLEKGLLVAMDIVGEKFKNNQVFVPEVLIAARAMNAGLEILKPLLASEEAGMRDKVTVVIGGAPVTQNFCDSINADIYPADAASAAEEAKEVCA